jgi:hypothetical protein
MATAGSSAGRLLSSRRHTEDNGVKKVMISSLIVVAPFLIMFLAWQLGVR